MSERDASRHPAWSARPGADAPHELPFEIRAQLDDTTCGPTCLHAVYRYFGDSMSLAELSRSIPRSASGGTLAVHLANHALERGYRARILTCNLEVFDPSWFRPDAPPLAERLRAQMQARSDPELDETSRAYLRFLSLGGRLTLEDLEPSVLRRPLARGLPIITGLSSTFLYRETRERTDDNEPDDVRGDPVGHFVVLTGYVPHEREVYVTDPLHPNPLSEVHTYRVPIQRVVGAIYLGVLTHDANLVVLEPDPEREASTPCRPSSS